MGFKHISRTSFVRLMGTASLLPFMAATAFAQPAAPAQSVEEVVVTGTHIRGVAPVGSSLTVVNTQELKDSGQTDVVVMLQKIPAVLAFGYNPENQGGKSIQSSGGNVSGAQSVNLRGIGGASTLSLVNGMRIAPNNSDGTYDLSTIPPIIVQRIDVVADGGSATYGTDAIAGTVNLIYKKPLDGLETEAQFGSADPYSQWHTSVLLGHTWSAADSGIGDGGLLIAYDHTYNSWLLAKDRPGLFTQDFSAIIGPTGLPPVNASPGNVTGLLRTGGATTDLYAVPFGIGSTQAVNLSQLGTVNVPNRDTDLPRPVVPAIRRDRIAVNFEQELTSWLTFTANGSAENRWTRGGRSNSAGVNLTVPNTNPYSPCATAAARTAAGLPAPVLTNTQSLTCPANGTVTVNYDEINEFGINGRGGPNKMYNYQGALDAKLPFGWHARPSVSVAYNLSAGPSFFGDRHTAINTLFLAAAVSGVNKPANIPFFNPFCDNTAAPCNPQIVDDYIASEIDATKQTYRSDEYNLAFDGPLYDLPAGTVKLALGAEYLGTQLEDGAYSSNNAANVNITSPVVTNRFATAIYGELYIPVFSDANAIPFVKKLELTLAGRITRYSDFGKTTNPKIGFNWTPVDGLQLRGSFGTSFKAPGLRSINPNSGASVLIGNNVSPASYAGTIGPTGVVSTLGIRGGTLGLGPETARTWSFGADWKPDFLDGFSASATYYRISYLGRVSSIVTDVGTTAAINLGYFDDLLVLNPTYFGTRGKVNAFAMTFVPGLTLGAPLTQTQYNAIVAAFLTNPQVTTAPLNPVAVVIDQRDVNAGNIYTDGIDFNAGYVFDTDWGEANVGLTGTYVLNYNESLYQTAPLTDYNNVLGHSIRLRARAVAGLKNGPWSGNLYVNYTNAYLNDLPTLPLTVINPQNYLHIASYTTFDLTLGYDFTDEFSAPLLHGVSLRLSARNLLDTKPPFVYLGGSTDNAQYDPTNASSIGRTLSIVLDKKW